MRPRLASVMLLLSLVCCGPAIAAGFQDSFGNAAWSADKWTILTPGRVTFATVDGNGVMRCEALDGIQHAAAAANNGAVYLVDGLSVSVSFNILSGRWGPELLFGGERKWAAVEASGGAHGSCYCVKIHPADSDSSLAGQVEVMESDLATGWLYTMALTPQPEAIRYNQWYTLRVVSAGGFFDVYLGPRGGSLVHVLTVAQDVLHPGAFTYTCGFVGLLADSGSIWTNALFDDFSLRGTLGTYTTGAHNLSYWRNRRAAITAGMYAQLAALPAFTGVDTWEEVSAILKATRTRNVDTALRAQLLAMTLNVLSGDLPDSTVYYIGNLPAADFWGAWYVNLGQILSDIEYAYPWAGYSQDEKELITSLLDMMNNDGVFLGVM